MLEAMEQSEHVSFHTLILVPSGELREQVGRVLEGICSPFGIRVTQTWPTGAGGEGEMKEFPHLEKDPSILVATPGLLAQSAHGTRYECI